MRLLCPLLLLAACDAAVPLPDGADAPPDPVAEAAHRVRAGAETEGRPVWLREAVVGGVVVQQDADGVFLDGEPWLVEAAGPVVIDGAGRRLVVVDRVDGGPETRLWTCAPPAPCRVRAAEGHPDRAALSDDGLRVAWVASLDGLPAVFVGPFDGTDAVQLTNVDLPPPDGGPPPGFVPPPHEGPLRFDGDALVWDAPDGPHRVRLP